MINNKKYFVVVCLLLVAFFYSNASSTIGAYSLNKQKQLAIGIQQLDIHNSSEFMLGFAKQSKVIGTCEGIGGDAFPGPGIGIGAVSTGVGTVNIDAVSDFKSFDN